MQEVRAREPLYPLFLLICRSVSVKRDGAVVQRYRYRNRPFQQTLFHELFSHFYALLPVKHCRSDLPVLYRSESHILLYAAPCNPAAFAAAAHVDGLSAALLR